MKAKKCLSVILSLFILNIIVPVFSKSPVADEMSASAASFD